MCLGVPGQVVRIQGKIATVDFWGTRRNVRLGNPGEPIFEGDYVLEHAGVIERKISVEDVVDTLAMYETLLCDAGCDPVATDIVDELESLDELIEEEVLV